MVKFTRRSLFGLAGGVAGSAASLSACQSLSTEAKAQPYRGGVDFSHGVASGDPLQTRVILWTHLSPSIGGQIDISWSVYADKALTEKVVTGVITTGPERDYTAKVDATGLRPGQDYYYRFAVETPAGPVVSPIGRTRTLPEAGIESVRAAMVSCSNYPFGYFHAYQALAQIEPALDVIIHLGDYLYEYGPDGYGGETGAALARAHIPPREITNLADYRTRHAQYKSDPALQAAHAAAPWICTWDDHESANDAYRTGAQNHDPSEGDWTERKQQAVQAYLEWMPVRDPKAGAPRDALWRRFDFGDVISLICLETRLTGRSEEISWSAELSDLAPEDMPGKAKSVMQRVQDPARTMLGPAQEAWLAGELKDSVATGKSWQVLANQVIMATVRPPNFAQTLSPEQIEAITSPFLKGLVGFSQMSLPMNLDAWDGFPTARERLYTAARTAGASLVTLTGDTHTGWANTLKDKQDNVRGVEFGCTSVTSPGFGVYLPGVEDLGEQFADANDQVHWHDPLGNGFTLLEFSRNAVLTTYHKVSDVRAPDYTVRQVAQFITTRTEGGKPQLEAV